MATAQRLVCPDCGAEMNKHAAKPMAPRSAAEAASPLGGPLAEVHQCPACGAMVSRRLT